MKESLPGQKPSEDGSTKIGRPRPARKEQEPLKDLAMEKTVMANTELLKKEEVVSGEPAREKTPAELAFEQGREVLGDMAFEAKETAARSEERLEATKERPISEFRSVEQFGKTMDDFERQMLESKKMHKALGAGLSALEAGTKPSEDFFRLVDALARQAEEDAKLLEEQLSSATKAKPDKPEAFDASKSTKAVIENFRQRGKLLRTFLAEAQRRSPQEKVA